MPSNPSSYAHLSDERLDFKEGNFQPVMDSECRYYHDYIYGLDRRNGYLNQMTRAEIRRNYINKDLVYLMSEEDKKEELLDKSCEANLQGKNRINRAMNYFVYLNRFYPEHRHRFVSIENIEHNHVDVFNSSQAAEVLFGVKNGLNQEMSFSYEAWGQRTLRPQNLKRSFLLMGGGQNDKEGLSKFLHELKGGNLLVITSKDYFLHRYTMDFVRLAEELKLPLGKVEVISFQDIKAGNHPFVLAAIKNADGIYFTGGNQGNYIQRIKGMRALDLINKKHIPIAGSSAGLAIMGEYIFAARAGGFSSRFALSNPLHPDIDIEKGFFYHDLNRNLITDTHFSERDREGRLLTFMYRALRDYGLPYIYGLGVDEKTSVWISDSHLKVFGAGDAFVYKFTGANSKLLEMTDVQWLKLEKNKNYTDIESIELIRSLDVNNGRIQKN